MWWNKVAQFEYVTSWYDTRERDKFTSFVNWNSGAETYTHKKQHQSRATDVAISLWKYSHWWLCSSVSLKLLNLIMLMMHAAPLLVRNALTDERTSFGWCVCIGARHVMMILQRSSKAYDKKKPSELF